MASDAVARKMASSRESHEALIDEAIKTVHSVGANAPRHIAVPVMHALLLGKHFALKGLKVPDHLEHPPGDAPKPEEKKEEPSKKSSDDEEEQDSGD